MAKQTKPGGAKRVTNTAGRAPTGSRTKGQTTRRAGAFGILSGVLSRGGVHSARCAMPGFLSEPSPATYQTYRQMRCNPTIAIARAALFAPVKANKWTYEAKDGTPDDRVRFIQEQFDTLKARLVIDILRAVEYGWQPFERVYGLNDDGMCVYTRAKALLPDESEPLVDKDTGALVGVRNGEARLSLQKAAVLTYDQEGDDPYGRSIYENIREDAWWPWRDAAGKLAQYYTKGAGVVPLIRYPAGKGQNADGVEVDNSENAANVLRTLGMGMGVTMPNEIDGAYEDLVRAGAPIADLLAWQVSFLETRAGVGGEISQGMRDYERLMVRGMLQPERSILEGQFGTKADAGSHGDLGLMIATELVDWAVGEVNRLFVDPLLVVNFGREAKGTVYIKPSPVVDEDRAFIRELMRATLTANPDLLMAVSDFDAMLDATGVPKSAEVVDTTAMPTGPAQIDVPGTVNKVMTEGTGDAVADTPAQPPQPAQTPTMASLARQIDRFRALGIVGR